MTLFSNKLSLIQMHESQLDTVGSLHCTVYVQCSAVQCSAVQCSAVRCSAVQCSVAQLSTMQCRAVQYIPDCALCRRLLLSGEDMKRLGLQYNLYTDKTVLCSEIVYCEVMCYNTAFTDFI